METLEARKIEQAAEYCRRLEQLDALSGNVLIAHRGQAVHHQSYGHAHLEQQVPNSPDGVFRIGSITKQFTAMAILMLEEQGLLGLDDVVAIHMPDYPNGERITIRELLNHTSGIPSFTGFPEYEKIMRQHLSLDGVIALFRDRPLAFEPGERFDYCNSGYVLLSRIIEIASTLPYGTFLEERILKPLGMKRAGLEPIRKLVPNRASGYEVWGDLVPASFIDMSIPSGAGAMIATTEDLYRWDQALHGGRLISSDAYTKMITPSLGNYGLGLFISEEELAGRNRRLIGHGGGINGFRSEYRRYMEEELTIIILCNRSVIDPGAIADKLARIMLGEEVLLPEAHAPIPLDAAAWAIAGEYAEVPVQASDNANASEGDRDGGAEESRDSDRGEENEGMKVTVALEDGRWFVSSGPFFKFELVPYRLTQDSVTFDVKYMNGQVTYRRSPGQAELIAEIFNGVRRFVRGC